MYIHTYAESKEYMSLTLIKLYDVTLLLKRVKGYTSNSNSNPKGYTSNSKNYFLKGREKHANLPNSVVGTPTLLLCSEGISK